MREDFKAASRLALAITGFYSCRDAKAGVFLFGPATFSHGFKSWFSRLRAMTVIKSTDLLQQFASDNYSGICPEAWAAMETANHGHVSDMETTPWTAAASNAFGGCLRRSARSFCLQWHGGQFLVLASLCQSYHAVICCRVCPRGDGRMRGAGVFLQRIEVTGGRQQRWKAHAAAVHQIAVDRTDSHYPRPRAVTISQSTETGRVYGTEELQALSAMAGSMASGCIWMAPALQTPAPV